MIGTLLGDERDDRALPAHFHEPLRVWCQTVMNRFGLAERVTLRVRVAQLRVPDDLLPSVRAILALGAEEATALTHDSGWYTSGVRLWSVSQDMFDIEAWREQIHRLERILQDGGSIWELTADAAGLQLRVSPAESAALQEATQAARDSTRPAAADDLAKAWKTAYGPNPSASEAYRLAVRAVEHVGVPIVAPADGAATLGKLIEVLRDAPAGRWTFDPGTGHPVDPTAVRLLMEALWKGQDDRHGGQADFAEVTQSEAEAAVHLAAQLVRWFATGALTRSS